MYCYQRGYSLINFIFAFIFQSINSHFISWLLVFFGIFQSFYPSISLLFIDVSFFEKSLGTYTKLRCKKRAVNAILSEMSCRRSTLHLDLAVRSSTVISFWSPNLSANIFLLNWKIRLWSLFSCWQGFQIFLLQILIILRIFQGLFLTIVGIFFSFLLKGTN